MLYQVVFENTPELGGYAFVRTIVNYKDEAYFKANYIPNTREKVLAQGLSSEESANLCHLTPIITYYMAGIEDIFESGKPFLNLIDFFLEKATFAAHDVLKSRQENNLHYTVLTGLVEHLDRLVWSTNSPKTELMKAFYMAYDIETDTLNTKLLVQLVRENIHQN